MNEPTPTIYWRVVEKALRPIFRQGPWFHDHLNRLMYVIVKLYREEFTEDNIPNQRSMLTECMFHTLEAHRVKPDER